MTHWRTWHEFHNTETGKRTREDPRLHAITDLSETEWERIDILHMDNSVAQDLMRESELPADYFRNKVTGKVIDSDPRLTREALEAKGIKLEAFSIT